MFAKVNDYFLGFGWYSHNKFVYLFPVTLLSLQIEILVEKWFWHEGRHNEIVNNKNAKWMEFYDKSLAYIYLGVSYIFLEYYYVGFTLLVAKKKLMVQISTFKLEKCLNYANIEMCTKLYIYIGYD